MRDIIEILDVGSGLCCKNLESLSGSCSNISSCAKLLLLHQVASIKRREIITDKGPTSLTLRSVAIVLVNLLRSCLFFHVGSKFSVGCMKIAVSLANNILCDTIDGQNPALGMIINLLCCIDLHQQWFPNL